MPVTGLRQKLAVAAALLVAILLVVGGAAPAVAHGSHPHHATVERPQIDHRSEPGEMSEASAGHTALARPASERDLPQGIPDKTTGNADCCCGGLMCYVGATLPVAIVSHPFSNSARVVPEPSSSVEERVPSGLERPPRSPHSA